MGWTVTFLIKVPLKGDMGWTVLSFDQNSLLAISSFDQHSPKRR